MDNQITIIVPVYNSENYLAECLLSLVNQTYKNLVIICINDGSTDDSGNILNYFSIKYNNIKVFNQVNSGVSSARNRALKSIESTDFLMFVDSDDRLDINSCSILIELVNKTKTDAIFFNYDSFKFSNQKSEEYSLQTADKVLKNLILYNYSNNL
jgi:glycosyltransferase EpsH